MKLSATETFLSWVPMIPVGERGAINVKDATLDQVRTYREELRKKIDALNQMAVALDYLLVSASADADYTVRLEVHLRQRHPEEFYDE